MDIVGAINHSLIVGAGVRSRTRIKNGIVEVQLRVPTSPKPTILVARMPLSEYAEQVGGHVGGKIGKKIKKAAKKVVKNKAFKALTKVATGLAANIIAPGAGAALMTGVALAKKAKTLAKKAKKGDKKAAAILKAPLALKAVKPGSKPKGPVLSVPRDQPRPAAAPPMRALPASTESADSVDESSSDDAAESDSGDDAAELTSSDDEEEPVGAGVYMVSTPAGRQVKVTLP